MANHFDAVFIGGGAAGLLCAGFAARRGMRVAVLEKNGRPARKVRITGKGRCNVTNNCDNNDFIRAVRGNGRFLYSAIAAFSTADTMAFFEGLGVPLKTERGNRVFPVSDQATDIVDALVGFAKDGGAKIFTGQAAKEVLAENGQVTGVLLESGEVIPCTRAVIATGGKSYPLTGSTGDGYRMAQQLGHTIAPIKPSLIPIVAKEGYCAAMMGLSLRNVTLKVLDSGKKKPVFEELGEMLFTHFGVSGPLVLSASSHMTGDLSRYRMEIDLKPGLTAQQLDARLLRDFEENRNRDFANSLDALLPRKMIPVVVELSGIPAGEKVHQITREQRQGLCILIKAFPVTPKAFRPIEEAIVTSGGIKVGEINPKTMESKLVEGLFFAGEVIDVDGYTGGYNLQIAFSTGYLAAQNL